MIIKPIKTSLFTLLFAVILSVGGQQAIALEKSPSECEETVFPARNFTRTKGA
ncbi:hypothetical protein D1BOALGB6SA_3975 [Olavius sp. associated proteobacterium Delta 1]|nr:hypothetical protein D1BOALGB6SA_3975 [Olavius sp. associated proteobacterium Delta 1]